jgi:hypothetical protein
MKPDFDYRQVSPAYAHCYNANCVRAADCLRHFVTHYVAAHRIDILVINPDLTRPDDGNCPYFRTNRTKRFASGISHLYDNLTYNDALEIKRCMIAHFHKNTYSRMLNKQRLIKPKEQAFIRQLFKDRGIVTEPVFDEFVEEYEWFD